MTEENAGMTEENAGMTEENAGMTEENAGMTEENAAMTVEGAAMTVRTCALVCSCVSPDGQAYGASPCACGLMTGHWHYGEGAHRPLHRHGRPAKSLFRPGLDKVRRLLKNRGPKNDQIGFDALLKVLSATYLKALSHFRYWPIWPRPWPSFPCCLWPGH